MRRFMKIRMNILIGMFVLETIEKFKFAAEEDNECNEYRYM